MSSRILVLYRSYVLTGLISMVAAAYVIVLTQDPVRVIGYTLLGILSAVIVLSIPLVLTKTGRTVVANATSLPGLVTAVIALLVGGAIRPIIEHDEKKRGEEEGVKHDNGL